MHFADSNAIILHRVHTVKYGDDNYLLVRWGGSSMAATRLPGLQAMRLLNGRTIGEARRLLQDLFDSSSPPNLQPLLQVLVDANIIKRVNGARISKPEVTFFTISRFLYLYYVSPLLRRMAQRLLPIGTLPHAFFWINYIGNRRRIRGQLTAAASNIEAIFGDLSDDKIKALQREHYLYIARTKLDPEFLIERQAKEVHLWMEKHIRCQGLNQLREVAQQGVVAGIPHMHRFSLAPLVLLKNGFNVCFMGTSSIRTSIQKRREWYNQFSQLPGYGRLEAFPNSNLDSLRRAMHLIKQGYVLVTHPDAALLPFTDEAMRQRMHFFKMDYSGLTPTTIRVNLRHHVLSAEVLFFWLAAYSGAAFCPAVIVPGDKLSELRVDPPIDSGGENLSTAERTEVLARAFYSFWEKHLTEYPAQWFGWHLLDQWNLGSPAAAKTLGEGLEDAPISTG